MSTSSVKISSDGMYGIYKGIPRLWDLTEIQCGIRATLTAYGLPPYTHVWGGGGVITHFIVSCKLHLKQSGKVPLTSVVNYP